MSDRLNYRTHADLLDQIATSEEEARAVRRILGPELQRELKHLRDFDRSPRQPIDTPDLLADPERCIYTWRWVISGCLLTWAVLAAAGIAIFS